MCGTPLKWFKRRLNFVSCALTAYRYDYRAYRNIHRLRARKAYKKVVAGTLSTAAIPGIPIIADLAGKEGLFS
jgi:hypothetical protein